MTPGPSTSVRPANSSARDVYKRQPYINSVQVKREFPDGIAIRVTESVPIAFVPFLDGAVLIDQNGKALEKVTMDKTSNYLAIMGSEMVNFEPGEKIIVENQKKLQIILATVAEIVHNNLIGTVVEINVEDTSNIEYKLNGGRLTIMMGVPDELAYKTRFLKQILSELGLSLIHICTVLSQSPAAGSEVPIGTIVTVDFRMLSTD